jgi:isoleucyl-tRNA synthetase
MHGSADRPIGLYRAQRHWGVPMAFFVHKETGELHIQIRNCIWNELPNSLRKKASTSKIGPSWTVRAICADAQMYEKNKDTLDVCV